MTASSVAHLERLDREMFVAILLDGKNQVIGFNVVSLGSLTAALVHPREVFKPAILANAANLILAHNHPSGDPEPAAEDRAITERLRHAADLLGITDEVLYRRSTTAIERERLNPALVQDYPGPERTNLEPDLDVDICSEDLACDVVRDRPESLVETRFAVPRLKGFEVKVGDA